MCARTSKPSCRRRRKQRSAAVRRSAASARRACHAQHSSSLAMLVPRSSCWVRHVSVTAFRQMEPQALKVSGDARREARLSALPALDALTAVGTAQ